MGILSWRCSILAENVKVALVATKSLADMPLMAVVAAVGREVHAVNGPRRLG